MHSWHAFKKAHNLIDKEMAKQAGVGLSYLRQVQCKIRIPTRIMMLHVLKSNNASKQEELDILWEYGYLPQINKNDPIGTFPEEFKRFMKKHKVYSQTQIAKSINVHPSTVHYWVQSNSARWPRRDTIYKLPQADSEDIVRLCLSRGFVPYNVPSQVADLLIEALQDQPLLPWNVDYSSI